MIPTESINQWRTNAPWQDNSQVEQDLVLSRALVSIFNHPASNSTLALRGGTALNKLYMRPPARYSEDIDLVQVAPMRSGPIIGAIRSVLGPWLDKPKWKSSYNKLTITYRFASEDASEQTLRLKIEINTAEQFTVFGRCGIPFDVNSDWFTGHSEIVTYTLNELLATKMRALYERRKGRDLFDLEIGLKEENVDPERIVSAFNQYILNQRNNQLTRAQFEKNIFEKMKDSDFRGDIQSLLSPSYRWDFEDALEAVSEHLINRLPGKPWKGTSPAALWRA